MKSLLSCPAAGRRAGAAPGTPILLYHRIAPDSAGRSDPQRLAVTESNFAAHLDFLRREMRPLSLSAWREAACGGSLPPRAVVLTFDDGYADNLLLAAPLLRRFGVPATVFVATGYCESGRPFWWDAVEMLLLGPGDTPAELRGVADGAPEFSLVAAQAGVSGDARPADGWSVLRADDPTPRHAAYRAWCEWLRPLPPARREAAVDALRTWRGQVGGEPRGGAPQHAARPLTPDEVARLADESRVEIGAHTHWHPVLSALPPDHQAVEIAHSADLVQQWTGRPPSAFSYPFGTRRDYTAQTVQRVRQNGFRCACANHAGFATGATDPFALPRIVVRDGGADALARTLHALSAQPSRRTP